jgi:hypothetical protein
MTDDLSRLLVRELETFAREVELFPDDESLFKTLPGVANSAGNLGLHVCGNLQHFVGAVLGNTGYVRNRDAEFAARSGRRDDLARMLRETAAVVSRRSRACRRRRSRSRTRSPLPACSCPADAS